MVKKKYQQNELVFGVHAIIELLKAKRRKLVSIYTTKPIPKVWQQITKMLPLYVKVHYVPRESLTKMAGTADHQGVVAWAKSFSYRKKPFDLNKQPFLIMLDGIQDTRNLGAMLRSAYCAGVDGVILTQKGAAPLNASALKGSAGLAEYLEIYRSPSTKSACIELKSAGYNLYLAVISKKSDSALDIEYKQPLCLVIGSEAHGISKDILSVGKHVTLPQRRADISYNASVAAGILLFLIATQCKRI